MIPWPNERRLLALSPDLVPARNEFDFVGAGGIFDPTSSEKPSWLKANEAQRAKAGGSNTEFGALATKGPMSPGGVQFDPGS